MPDNASPRWPCVRSPILVCDASKFAVCSCRVDARLIQVAGPCDSILAHADVCGPSGFWRQALMMCFNPLRQRIKMFGIASVASAVILLALGASSGGVRAQTESSAPVATIGARAIIQAEIDEFLNTLPRQPGEASEAFLTRGTELYLAQIVAKTMIANAVPEGIPEIEAEVAKLRARLSLDYLVAQQLRIDEPSREDVDAFIAENPHLFKGRATFRYASYVIVPESEAQRSLVLRRLDLLQRGPRPDARSLQAFMSNLQRDEITAIGRSQTSSSEQMEPALLDRLEELARGGQSVLILEDTAQIEVLVLLERVSDPVDPRLMRQQISTGLIRQEIERQRAEIVRDLAANAVFEADRAEPIEEAAADIESELVAPEPSLATEITSESPYVSAILQAGENLNARFGFEVAHILGAVILGLSSAAIALGGFSAYRWMRAARIPLGANRSDGLDEIDRLPRWTDYAAMRIPLALSFFGVVGAANLVVIAGFFPSMEMLRSASAVAGGSVFGAVSGALFYISVRTRYLRLAFWATQLLQIISLSLVYLSL
jgi:hypothetical protein